MRIILRTMDLPGKSAALYRPRKSPILLPISIQEAFGDWTNVGNYLTRSSWGKKMPHDGVDTGKLNERTQKS